MWSEVELNVGDAHGAGLAEDNIFFKPVLEQSALMACHENTVPSAEAIIRLLVENHRLPPQIQTVLVDEHKDIVETSAGQEFNWELDDKERVPSPTRGHGEREAGGISWRQLRSERVPLGRKWLSVLAIHVVSLYFGLHPHHARATDECSGSIW